MCVMPGGNIGTICGRHHLNAHHNQLWKNRGFSKIGFRVNVCDSRRPEQATECHIM